MGNLAIRVEGLSKQYRIGAKQERYRTLRDVLADTVTAPFRRAGRLLRGEATGAAGLSETIWALKDVSFDVQHGEVVGIIGRNGAGKSTLLKILSRITEPTEGYVDLYGRVGSLLEVGTGFHPELTGRENIYLNGAILGMKRAEIERKFDEIVDFAEIEKFIDTPVKHYSSGMYVRLAFAVAAHLEPEILLVDEVLAVGDVAFQKKCLGKMGEVAGEGRTVLFVSHNMAAVQALCAKGTVLEHGHISFAGEIGAAIDSYLKSLKEGSPLPLGHRTDRFGTGYVQLTDLEILGDHSEPTSAIHSGEHVVFVFRLANNSGSLPVTITIRMTLYDHTGYALAHFSNMLTNDVVSVPCGEAVVHCELPSLPLRPGHYSINAAVERAGEYLDHVVNAAQFTVVEGDFFGTGRSLAPNAPPMLVHHFWRLMN